MQVEPATATDLGECRQLITESIRVLAAPCYSPTQIEAWLGQYPEAAVMATWTRRLMFLVRDASRIVGFGQIDPGRTEIVGVHVAPARAREGIGARLVHTMEQAAIEAGLPTVHVQASLNAVDFYAACGYWSLREITFQCDNGVVIDARHMQKVL